jgi:excisionase family DNA binding protein
VGDRPEGVELVRNSVVLARSERTAALRFLPTRIDVQPSLDERLADRSPLLTIKDVAAACKLSETAVRRAIADGELPAVKLRSRMRITREHFNGWIASKRQTPARRITPLRAASRVGRPAPAGSFRALVQADAARAAGNTARTQAR